MKVKMAKDEENENGSNFNKMKNVRPSYMYVLISYTSTLKFLIVNCSTGPDNHYKKSLTFLDENSIVCKELIVIFSVLA